MPRTTGIAVVGVVLAIVSGVEILTHGPLYRLDRRVALYYWPITNTLSTNTAKFLAHIGTPEWACFSVGALALMLCWRQNQIRPAVAAIAGLGIVGVSTLILKGVFPRVGIWGHPGSFPSGHTGVAVVASGLVVYLLLPRRHWREPVAMGAAAIWGTIMAWGRLVIETHWLSDVLAGWGIGMVALVAAIRLADSPLGNRGWARSTPDDR